VVLQRYRGELFRTVKPQVWNFIQYMIMDNHIKMMLTTSDISQELSMDQCTKIFLNHVENKGLLFQMIEQLVYTGSTHLAIRMLKKFSKLMILTDYNDLSFPPSGYI